MNIPLVEDTIRFDVCDRLYRRAILNTLIELKPKHCLEIGTHIYQSSEVFSYYFNQYQPEGKLITVDISQWTRKEIPPDNVYPVMVYPHSLDVEDRHQCGIYHFDWKKKLEAGGNSVLINGRLISDKMNELGISIFDLVFIDGDHSRNGIWSDIYITLGLTCETSYILIDDVNDKRHEQFHMFHNELKPKNPDAYYCYEDWNPNPGMAFVKTKDFLI